MQSPRQLLAALSIALAVIGVQTLISRPSFLPFWPVWSATMLLASCSCLAVAVNPRRLYIALSGATVVTSSAARGLAFVIKIILLDDHAASAPLVVAATTWAIVALLSFVVWREYVLPWSITIGRPDDSRS